MRSNYDVIVKPLITEKSAQIQAKSNRVHFEVHRLANKAEIRDAVQKVFNVTVTDVHTMVVPGKPKRSGRAMVKRPSWKKASVTLKEGDKIEFFEGA